MEDKVSRRPSSVGRMFLDRVAATPDNEAYRRPVGDTWESMTTIEAGELTPSMKVKRRAVEKLHKGLLDEMYAKG